MRRVDLSQDTEIAELTDILRHASTVTEPPELIATFGGWIGRRVIRDYFVSVSRRNLPEGKYKVTRAIPVPPDGTNPPPREFANPWRDWNALEEHEGGLLGEILSTDSPQLIMDLDLTTDPVLSRVMGPDAAGMRSLAAMPTFDRGEALNWGISFSRRNDWITTNQFADGLLDINLMGTATRNLVVLREFERVNARLADQMEQLGRIQRALLPAKIPQIDGLKIATSYLTSYEAGGDYYDFVDFGNGQWGFLIADVAGHGAAAATVMALLRGVIHSYEGDEQSPAAVLRFCNEKLAAAKLDGSFTTAFAASFDLRTGGLTWSRCGHNPPRLRRADGTVEPLDAAGSLPLGIMEDAPIEEASTTMRPGDTLVMYTDGITEAFGKDRNAKDMFGVERMDRAIADCSGEPSCIIDSIHSALFAHTGVMDRDDDQTLMVVRRTD